MEKVVIYHNPACGTSRNVLAIIRHVGIEPEIVHYLDTPPSEEKLHDLLSKMGITAKDLLRTNVPPYHEWGLIGRVHLRIRSFRQWLLNQFLSIDQLL